MSRCSGLTVATAVGMVVMRLQQRRRRGRKVLEEKKKKKRLDMTWDIAE